MSAQKKPRRPATTAEGRENQLIALALDVVERQMTEGSVSSQVLLHFLKLATGREKLEQQRLQNENLLLSAKVEQISSANDQKELYAAALKAMKAYSGQEDEEDDYDGYED